MEFEVIRKQLKNGGAKYSLVGMHPAELMKSEHEHQAEIFAWAEGSARRYGAKHVHKELGCMYAIPNAGKRSIGAAMYMRREGLKKSTPDICLPVARRGSNALYIELKRQGGCSDEGQEKKAELLREHGNCVVFCVGATHAIKTIPWYLEVE